MATTKDGASKVLEAVNDLKTQLETMDAQIAAMQAERAEIVDALRGLIPQEEQEETVAPKRRGRPAGSSTGGKRGPAKGSKREGSLATYIQQYLSKHKNGAQIDKIVDGVIKAGYKTKSSADKFPATVYQTLRKMVNDEELKVDEDKNYAAA